MLGPPMSVNVSAPPPEALVSLVDYGTGNTVLFRGWARCDQGNAASLGTVSAFTAANPGVITFATAHGFNYDITDAKPTMQPVIAIAGGTGNWKPANGVWIFQPTSTTTGTIASIVSGSLTQLNTTGFGAVTGTLSVTTRCPQTSQAVWAIQWFVYNASSALLANGFVANPIGAGSGDPSRAIPASKEYSFIWDNRANLAFG